MTRNRKALIVSALLAVAGGAALMLAGPSLQRSIFYPKPRDLPAAVAGTTEELLTRLQLLLESDLPTIAQALQPGLSDEQITALEEEGDFRLSNDLTGAFTFSPDGGSLDEDFAQTEKI